MISKQNVGNAGEYFISALLSAKDFVVTVTLGRNIGYDLLVENPKGHTLKISVKTTMLPESNKFVLNKKSEEMDDNNLFYAFVRLNNFKKMPDYWILPAKEVADISRISYENWYKTPGKKGQKHQETSIRNFFITNSPYLPEDWIEKLEYYKENIDILVNF